MSREVFDINPGTRRKFSSPRPPVTKAGATGHRRVGKRKGRGRPQAGNELTKQAPGRPWGGNRELYNGMIAPLIPYAIQGAIWYQGESNAGRAEQYRTLFPDMIRNWRRDWGQGDFHVPRGATRARSKRDQGSRRTATGPNSARPNCWPPSPAQGRHGRHHRCGRPKGYSSDKEEPVGARLALAARAIAHGEKIEFSGPIYRKLKIKGNQAILHFDHARKGLEARGGALKGFAICGADRKFVWAKAEIVGDTVVVSSPEVAKPVAVRYGWADFPEVNLGTKKVCPRRPSAPTTSR